MRLSELLDAMEAIAPVHGAESWDNVGLLVGDAAQAVNAVLLCIDYTGAVAEEARQLGCDAIVAYHPPIFHPLKRITGPSPLFDAIRRGVAIYSPHTALDVADGGTNDMLADVLGLTQRRPLRAVAPRATHCKLVTFVPEPHVERLSAALFAAGAGRLGNYTQCSFRSAGTGTFYGQPGSNPSVGHSGRLEQVAEVRLEMIVPVADLSPVIEALRQAHPYEEPAFDLLQMAAPVTGSGPHASFGQGRIGTVSPAPRGTVIERIRAGLGVAHLLVAGPTDGTITRAACCAGACGDLVDDALAQRAELYLTGEMRHHDALRAAAAGMTVVCALHSNSERGILRSVGTRLSQRLPGLNVHISQADRDPLVIR